MKTNFQKQHISSDFNKYGTNVGCFKPRSDAAKLQRLFFLDVECNTLHIYFMHSVHFCNCRDSIFNATF